MAASQKSDFYGKRLGFGVLSWPVYLNPTSMDSTVSRACETGGQMDCQFSPSRQAAAGEDSKQRRSSASDAEVKVDTSARAD